MLHWKSDMKKEGAAQWLEYLQQMADDRTLKQTFQYTSIERRWETWRQKWKIWWSEDHLMTYNGHHNLQGILMTAAQT